jgi:hypothetical protein
MPESDAFVQQAFAGDYQRYLDWKMNNVRYETEFGIVHVPPSKDAKIDWEKIEDDESFNKRVGAKILKFRAAPKEKFEFTQFKDAAMKNLKESASVKEFRESNFKSFNNSQGSLQVSAKPKKSPRAPLPVARTEKQQANA